jgi:hypothetical protein
MWEGIEDKNQDMRWLVEGIWNGTVVAVADASYNSRKTAPDVSGAGLVLCCTKGISDKDLDLLEIETEKIL